LARCSVNQVTNDGDAGGLNARDGVINGVEFWLVVTEIENRGNAAGERREKRKIDRPSATAGDDVAVFEGVAIDEDSEGHAGMRRAELVDAGDQLRRAFVGGVLIAHDQHEGLRFGIEISSAEPRDG